MANQFRPNEIELNTKKRARTSKHSVHAHRRILPYLALLPAVIAIAFVQVIPTFFGVIISMLKLTQFTIGNWIQAPFAALQNFWLAVNVGQPIGRELFVSLGVTCAYTVVVVGVSWILGMAAAVFLTDQFRGRGWLRSLFILPYALPAYVGVMVWTFMFQPNGSVNSLLGKDLHLISPGTFWLAGIRAFVAIAITAIWRTWPFAFLMLLAGMQDIPQELYEAARVDGASRWKEFWGITLPSVRNVSLLLVLITGFWTFTDFTTPFVMFSTSPPVAARLMSLQIYVDSFVNLNFGLGAAMSVIMVLFLLIIATVYIRVFRMRIGEMHNG
ncbi:sugar ABC transporter permease [Alicyclobacillus fastidiosus]|uniref:Sugar ABC transporter permease n=1 Tax=Alicyclobacillus fastidiosus TaxID=392011 RepID=A0ABY6ZFD0_9BACL|nr:sugar ABC transporter permease [Alicyclobacillus fastidiosus]WAH41440.1 sugar ABC transporter permease [Alicyclobacillus fastidiosus]GMA63069.1 ABC transporter permease [Alicyclobacillus fastidiosus]